MKSLQLFRGIVLGCDLFMVRFLMIYKKDGHPTHRSLSVESLLANSSIGNQETPPYDHEGVGAVEFTWSHDVPSAK